MQPLDPQAKLLIVDDESAHVRALCDTLQDAGYIATGFTSPRAALEAMRNQVFDLLLTDLMMPEMDGIAVLTEAQEIDRDVVAIVMTGHGAVDTAVEAMKAGALDYIQKPFRLSKIEPVLARALLVRRLRTENIQLREAVAIHRLTTEFASEHEWRTVVKKVADAAFEQSDDGKVSLLTPLAEGRELRTIAVRGVDAARLLALRVPKDAAFDAWLEAIRDKLTNPLANEPLFSSQSPFASAGVDAAIPLLAGGNLSGVLTFTSGHKGRALTAGKLKTLIGLASAAAAALEIALLLDRLRSANIDLERCVRQRTAQLETANKELEAFSYSISHDLRSPLRAIDGYTALLLGDVEGLPQAKQSAEAIRAATQRMMQLIADMLELSRLGSEPLHKQPVDIASLARQIADETCGPCDQRRVDVTIDPLPECMGDESLLRQVLINLIGNAAKFTRQRTEPRIEVGARGGDGETVYFVKDNGAGFDMQQAAKLFGVFQRLHSPRDFEGTGIGLSIVQRIVSRHGGRTWAEGEVGKGATFYFSIPHAVAPIES